MNPKQMAFGKKARKPIAANPIAANSSIIDTWIRETCSKCGRLDVVPLIGWEFTNDPRFRYSENYHESYGDYAGLTQCSWDENKLFLNAHIWLSIPYWKNTIQCHHKTVLVHEVCHALAVAIYGPDQAGLAHASQDPHAGQWLNLMHICDELALPNGEVLRIPSKMIKETRVLHENCDYLGAEMAHLFR